MKQKAIALLLIVMIIVAGSTLWLSKSQEVMTGAQDILRTELSNALGSLVTVGEIEIVSYNKVAIHNITIYDKQSEQLATSEKIIVSYSPMSILRGQAVASTISEVTIAKPTFRFNQRSNGVWNLEDVLEQKKSAESAFSGKVKLLDGTAMISTAGTTWSLEKISGKLDFAHKPSMELELQALHKESAVKVEGTINNQGRSTVTARVGELALADYQVLYPQTKPLGIVGGTVKDVILTVARDKESVEWAGEASLAGVDIDIDEIPVRQVTGNMSFTNKNIYLFMVAKVFEQPVKVVGNIGLDASQPILDLMVSSTAFDPSVIKNNIPISGKLAFNAAVTGITTNPIIDGDVSLAAGEIAGYAAYSAQANLLIANKLVKINKCSADMLGGHIIASGTLQPEAGSYQLRLKAQHVDMANVANLSGYGDANVAVSGSRNLAGADVQGTLTIGQGEFSGVAFSSLTSEFYQHDGRITIDYLNIDLGKGLVTASGVVDNQALYLNTYGQDIPLNLLGKLGNIAIDGSGQFDGQITGNLSAPEFIGDFTAVNGQAFYQPFKEATGKVHVTPEQIALNDIEVIDGVTKHTLQGTVGLKDQREMNIKVVSSKARAENIIKLLAPGEKLTGNIDNEVTLTGPIDNVNVEGRLKLTDGSFRGQLIAKGEGLYKREQGITTIDNFIINSLNTQIVLTGSINANNNLDFDVVAQNVDLARFNVLIPYGATGQAKFKGKLTGTASEPIFNGELLADKICVNNQEFGKIIAGINVYGNQIDIPYASFVHGVGLFNFAGGFDRKTHEIYANLDVENAEIKPLLEVLKISDKEIHGRLNGNIRINGTVEKPNIWLSGNLKDGSIKKYQLQDIKIDVALENNIFTINDFSAKQGSGILMARGTADLNGPIALEVGGRDIDAGLVTAWFNTDFEATGKLEFAAQVSGETSNPHTALSMEVANGGVGTATFDSLYGLLILDKNSIRVNQILLKKGPYRASAYGIIPVAALSDEGRQQANIVDQMDLKVRLDEANLSILPFLTKEVAWAEGQTQGELAISGTLARPVLKGHIGVNNGVVKLVALNDPIQKVGVDINFEDDTININKFEGHMGTGLYSLTGTAKLRGMDFSDYNLSLALNKPNIRSKYFTGIIDGNLNFNNKKNKPLLSGKLLFENDIVNIPTIPDMAASNMDIGLDVEMIVGKKVRFYNPYMYDILAEGKMHFAGSTLEPNPSGSIVAVRGTVSYLRTQFNIDEARVDFIQFASFEPIIKLNAHTALQQTVVNLKVSGPARTMQFDLTSEPAMRQQEILSLLTLRSRYSDKQNNGDSGLGRDELVGILDAGLQMRFISEVEGSFRSALGLDEFKLVRDTSSEIVKKSNSDKDESAIVSREVYNLEMGKYLTDKLLLSYTMGVGHEKGDLAFRYALNKRTNITGSIDKQNNTWFGIETGFKF